MKVQTFYDQSTLVRDSIASVRDAILIGLVLAAIILVLFLRDWGSSLVAALVIPATIAITLIALRILGESFNLMTLGGLAAAVGLVIDDAIVVVENIVLHRDSGQSRAEAIRSALREIRVPLVGSTITPIVVFLPLISITGVTGTFFRALAITVGTALLTSLALALTWTPTLSHYLLRSRASGNAGESSDAHGHVAATGFMGRVTRVYDRALRFVLAYPLALGVGCVGSDRGVVLLLPRARQRPAARDGRRRIHSRLPDAGRIVAGRHQRRCCWASRRFSRRRPKWRARRGAPDCNLGLAAVTEANNGDFSGQAEARPQTAASTKSSPMSAPRSTRSIPQLDVEFIQVLQDMIGDLTSSPEPIEIKLFSQDPALLKQWAPKIGDKIKKIKGVADVKDGIENTISGSAIVMNVDPVVAARARFHAAGNRTRCQRDSAR